MAVLRVNPLALVRGGKARKAKQTKYGQRKGVKPAGIINVLRK